MVAWFLRYKACVAIRTTLTRSPWSKRATVMNPQGYFVKWNQTKRQRQDGEKMIESVNSCNNSFEGNVAMPK